MRPLLRVKDVMVDKVVTIKADETAQLAAETMGKYNIGCLIVLEDDKVLGIVTERDLLNRVLVVAADPAKIPVRQVMSSPVVTVKPDTSLDEAVEVMFKHRIKKLPVVEQRGEIGVLVGLVTLTDIARLHPALIMTLRKFFEMLGEAPPKRMEKVMNYYVV
jgi:CBS domain-containing protein